MRLFFDSGKEEVFIDENFIKFKFPDLIIDFNFIAPDLIIINFNASTFNGEASTKRANDFLDYLNSLQNVQARFLSQTYRQIELSTIDGEKYEFAH
jgi:hypothetical protein